MLHSSDHKARWTNKGVPCRPYIDSSGHKTGLTNTGVTCESCTKKDEVCALATTCHVSAEMHEWSMVLVSINTEQIPSRERYLEVMNISFRQGKGYTLYVRGSLIMGTFIIEA